MILFDELDLTCLTFQEFERFLPGDWWRSMMEKTSNTESGYRVQNPAYYRISCMYEISPVSSYVCIRKAGHSGPCASRYVNGRFLEVAESPKFVLD